MLQNGFVNYSNLWFDLINVGPGISKRAYPPNLFLPFFILACLIAYRSCALFLRYVTNVNPPESLERNDSFDEICNYLGVPNNITSYFDVCGQTSLDPLVQRYILSWL